jgi:hypothetical protein
VTAGHHLSTTFDGAIKNRRKTSDSVREEIQIMTLLIRKNETQFEKHELGDRFVSLLKRRKTSMWTPTTFYTVGDES